MEVFMTFVVGLIAGTYKSNGLSLIVWASIRSFGTKPMGQC